MRNIIASALFVALIVVCTIFVKIPLAVVGYVHLGDAFIFFACYFLRPRYSVIVGGIGSAIADLILGFVIYAPATFAIKALLALVCALIIYKKPTLIRQVFSVVVGAIIVAFGYFVFESLVYEVAVAAANIPFNLIQGIASGIIAVLLIKAANTIKPLRDFKDRL